MLPVHRLGATFRTLKLLHNPSESGLAVVASNSNLTACGGGRDTPEHGLLRILDDETVTVASESPNIVASGQNLNSGTAPSCLKTGTILGNDGVSTGEACEGPNLVLGVTQRLHTGQLVNTVGGQGKLLASAAKSTAVDDVVTVG